MNTTREIKTTVVDVKCDYCKDFLYDGETHKSGVKKWKQYTTDGAVTHLCEACQEFVLKAWCKANAINAKEEARQ